MFLRFCSTNLNRNIYNSLLVALFIVNFYGACSQSYDLADEDLPTTCSTRDNASGSIITNQGLCVSISRHLNHCAPLQELFLERKWDEFRKHLCVPPGYKLPKVCCPLLSYTKVPPQTPDPDFRQHKNFKLLPTDECGVNYHTTESKIIGGLSASPGDFPWMARIILTDQDGRAFPACGGTIISKRYILTAAHCFKKIRSLESVRLAENDEDKESECIRDCLGDFCPNDGVVACSKVEEFEPEELKIHEEYRYKTGSDGDIALIRLKRDINITNWFTRPICLPFLDIYNTKDTMEDEKLIGKKGYVAGWGKTSIIEDYGSSVLQYAAVPMVPIIECQLVHGTFEKNQPLITISKTQICAGGMQGKTAYIGDSGGPLTYIAPTKLNDASRKTKFRQIQLGIVSYGSGNGNEAKAVPAFYTRVRSYLKWILDTIEP